MVYQGKPSAGCQNCRKRKIKVRARDGSLKRPDLYHLSRHSPFFSAMNLSQPALNASTPKGNALATLPVSTSSYVTKLKLSGGRPNARSSNRMKGQSLSHHLRLQLRWNPSQRHGPLLIPEETLPALSLNVIRQMNLSPGCSTISRSNKPFVPSSSISYFSPAIPTLSKAISSTYYLCTPTLVLTRLCP